MKDGIHQGISNDDYHADSALSNSDIKHFKKSPYHFIRAKKAQLYEPYTSDAMELGSAIHTAILEPHLYEDQVCVAGVAAVARSEKWNKMRKDLHKEGRLLIGKNDQADTIDPMVAAAKRHHLFKAIFEGPGMTEVSVWNTLANGAQIRARIDRVPLKGNALVDIKTCLDASQEGFGRASHQMGYIYQAAHYLRCWNAQCEEQDVKDTFVFFAIEKGTNAIGVYEVQDHHLEVANMELEGIYQSYANCMKKGKWPSYAATVQPLTLPEWAENQFEQILNEGN